MRRCFSGIFSQQNRWAFACLTLACLLTACGHKGPLIAPEPENAPQVEPIPKQLTLPAPEIQEQE